MTALLVFDIETIPDLAGFRRIHSLDATLPDDDVMNLALQYQRAKSGHDFMPLHLQRIVAISCLLRMDRAGQPVLNIWSLGDADTSEGELIQRFYDGIERYSPRLVSWNGGGFDLPVLHYRGMLHGVKAERYWDWGDGNYDDSRDFKWNNYLSRYHMRHLDLMDVLAMYQGRANAPLDQLARLMGFPGKLGMDGSQVAAAYYQGEIEAIRQYCETDVLNTYLVYTRFRRMRGELTAEAEAEEQAWIRDFLNKAEAPHWREYLSAWI